jgi:hypothetical protein
MGSQAIQDKGEHTIKALPRGSGAAFDVHEESERTAGLLQENPRLGHPGRVADTRALDIARRRALSRKEGCNEVWNSLTFFLSCKPP